MVINSAAVFLDRDGVINEPIILAGKPFSPRHRDHFFIFPEIADKLRALHFSGWKIIVVSNQPDVSRGKMKEEELDWMSEQMRIRLPLDAIKICRHDERDNCDCRKPKSGLITEAIEEFTLDPSKCFFVGDRFSDVLAARGAGIEPLFVDNNYAETPAEIYCRKFSNSALALDYILQEYIDAD